MGYIKEDRLQNAIFWSSSESSLDAVEVGDPDSFSQRSWGKCTYLWVDHV